MMRSDAYKYLLLLAFLLLLQIFVFPLVQFWSISPFIYIFAILILPAQWSVYPTLLLAFGSGLLLDFALDCPGLHTMSATLMAYLRQPVLRWAASKEALTRVSEKSLGFLAYWKYMMLLVFIHHACYFLLESFSFLNLPVLLLKIVGSTLASLLLMLLLERFRRAS